VDILSGFVVLVLAAGSPAVDLDRQLCSAAKSGDESLVESLLEQGADPNAVDESGQTALMGAVFDSPGGPSKTGIVELLLKRGADPNTRNPYGITALIFAAASPSPSASTNVKILIERGARVDDWGNGVTALINAAWIGTPETLDALLAAGADPNAKIHAGDKNPSMMPALSVAARRGNPGMVQALLDAGAVVDHQNGSGHTALMMAAEEGHLDVVEILLGVGADPELKCKDGLTARRHAAMNGHRAVAKRLKKAEAVPS